MTLRRWGVLIGAVTLLGLAKVAQQTALVLAAYDAASLYTKAHKAENEALWLQAKVATLESPYTLANTMNEQGLSLVAWSELPADAGTRKVALAGDDGQSLALADGVIAQ